MNKRIFLEHQIGISPEDIHFDEFDQASADLKVEDPDDDKVEETLSAFGVKLDNEVVSKQKD